MLTNYIINKRIYHFFLLGILSLQLISSEKGNFSHNDSITSARTVSSRQKKRSLVLPIQQPDGFSTTYVIITGILGILVGLCSVWLGYSYQYGWLGSYLSEKIAATWVRVFLKGAITLLLIYLFINMLTFIAVAFSFKYYQDQIKCQASKMVIPSYLTMADFNLYPLQQLVSLGERIEIPYSAITVVREIRENNSKHGQIIFVLDSESAGEHPYLYLPSLFIQKGHLANFLQFLQKKGVAIDISWFQGSRIP
ncbi:MAG: hypothetical protein AAF770_00980 [Bacteroidota bacterium]